MLPYGGNRRYTRNRGGGLVSVNTTNLSMGRYGDSGGGSNGGTLHLLMKMMMILKSFCISTSIIRLNYYTTILMSQYLNS